MTSILGISAFYHDSAAALVIDGEIVAAAHEERFSRVKHDERYPSHAVDYCLAEAGLAKADVDAVVFYEKPLIKFDRITETFFAVSPRGLKTFLHGIPLWATQRLHIGRDIRAEMGPDWKGRLLYTEHHRSHAASAFYPSPFEEAAILTIDGVGEWATTTIGHGKGNEFELLDEIHFPHSLGLIYSAFTYFCGFKVNSGEYKLMGLAPYGEPIYADAIRKNLIDLAPDGSFSLAMEYFDYTHNLRMTGPGFERLFGGPARTPESPITKREMDLAASIQIVTEEAMLGLTRRARELTGSPNLCMAGGVALNCVGNGRIVREKIFDNIWIQPAAGDAGGALGAALEIWHRFYKGPRADPQGRDAMRGSLLGPCFSDDEIAKAVGPMGAVYKTLTDEDLPGAIADLLASENIVGFFWGRMEFGPRALGARSIIADPRSKSMQRQLNLKIKFREGFRPFAPVVLAEKCSEVFDLDVESPYMLLVAPIREALRRNVDSNGAGAGTGLDRVNEIRSIYPSITHVDYSARVQTADPERNEMYYRVIKAFEDRTGSPVVVNTSFNIRGEPIVCRPEEAYRCFMYTNMDVLVLGHHILLKSEQPPLEGAEEYKSQFKLD